MGENLHKIHTRSSPGISKELLKLNNRKTNSPLENLAKDLIGTSSKKIYSDNHRKRRPTSYAIGELQIEVIMRHHRTSIRTPKTQKLTRANANEEAQPQELSFTVTRNAAWYSHVGRESLTKKKHRVSSGMDLRRTLRETHANIMIQKSRSLVFTQRSLKLMSTWKLEPEIYGNFVQNKFSTKLGSNHDVLQQVCG